MRRFPLMYYLLIFAPIAIIARIANVDEVVVFILAALGLIPLAKVIGDATEELAIRTGPKVGGLLNATLGNAAELIITIFALQAGLLDLVRASITGSIIGNLLLVLGASIFAGGWKHGIQKFDRRTASINATLAVLAVVALAIPSLFDRALVSHPNSEQLFSEGVALVLIVLYGLNILYAFRAKPADTTEPLVVDEEEFPSWSLRLTLIVLVGATIATALVSETLVGAVEPVVQSLGLTEFFVGLIIIPLIGNIAEHVVSIQVAMKNKMELSLAVSLGSSLQIALFVAPVLVFISLLFNTHLLLVFNDFELIILFGAALIAALIALDGESNWLEGAMLIAVYLIAALAFYFLPSHASIP